MAPLTASTWNALGLGVASSWAALGLVTVLDPHRTAELFGISALGHDKTPSRESLVGFSGLVASRDLAIGIALFLLGRERRNAEMGTLILSTLCVSVADIYLVWRRKSHVQAAALAAGSCVWGIVGLGLSGFFD